ncbi:MAG: Crp/Fnr family transcriptional regulator [Kiritimatiellae bacterium]|nr:Crp/Fnr family transcriptional regulator [Kiritimatiellia bacterium]
MKLNKAALLSQSSFFQGLPEADCMALAERSQHRQFRKREILFHEDTPGTAMFLLIFGTVQLTKMGDDGRQTVIRTLKAGEVFAEVILQADSRYPVTAEALTDADVLQLDRQHIFGLLGDPSFRDDFISFLMRKQRYLAERVRYLTVYDLEDRFFRFMREQYGERDQFEVTLSKKDIASAIGATPETFSRLVLRLKQQGRIDWQGRMLSIK